MPLRRSQHTIDLLMRVPCCCFLAAAEIRKIVAAATQNNLCNDMSMGMDQCF